MSCDLAVLLIWRDGIVLGLNCETNASDKANKIRTAKVLDVWMLNL